MFHGFDVLIYGFVLLAIIMFLPKGLVSVLGKA
jgi:hypothetical protein